MSQKGRPVGVAILAALQAFGGLVWLLAGAGMIMVGTLLPMFFGAAAGLMGPVFLVFGVIALVLAYGLFTCRRWAWLWSLIFAVIGIVLALLEAMASLGSAILPIIIYLITIYYLTRPHVKASFAK